jgi:hypothetical protein
MHNNFMCFAHRDAVIPPVIENEPFHIPHLDSRAAIQQALGNLAALLANNPGSPAISDCWGGSAWTSSAPASSPTSSRSQAATLARPYPPPKPPAPPPTTVISTAAQRSGETPAVLPPQNPNHSPHLQPPVILRQSRRIPVVVTPPNPNAKPLKPHSSPPTSTSKPQQNVPSPVLIHVHPATPDLQ